MTLKLSFELEKSFLLLLSYPLQADLIGLSISRSVT